jgi:hypothetical protein
MSQIDTSDEHRIGRDWIKSIALVLICVLVTMLMIYATTTTGTSRHDIRFRNGAYVMLPFMAPFTLWVVYRLFVPIGALLCISRDGFADRRVSPQIIPWSEISNIVRRGEFTSLTLSRTFLPTYRFSLSQRLLKWRRKSARPSHLLIADWCLARGETALVDILKAYHTAYSGRPATT